MKAITSRNLYFSIVITFSMIVLACHPSRISGPVDQTFLGNFVDDYGIRYKVSTTEFVQKSDAGYGKDARYHILEWNTQDQYIIAKNDAHNPSEKNLYSRIDYTLLTDMQPYHWGFCYTVYSAATRKEAVAAASADKEHPKTGCNGYPFSRLKRVP